MMKRRELAPGAATLAGILAVFCSSLVFGQNEVTQLVRQLPTNKSVGGDAELEKRIADLGTHALPGLANELRLGIPFKALDQLLKSEGSRRWAVVRVLTQIPGKDSTDLLVKSLSDPPDCYAMRAATLESLAKRPLSDCQVAAMLGNHEPMVVLAGLGHAAGKMEVLEIKRAVEELFDKGASEAQFRNEYGKSTASPDTLWEVRLATGRLLNRDMVPEIRATTLKILADLQREALHPTEPNTAARMSSMSQAEVVICDGLNKLHALGQPVKDLVEFAAKEAQGNHAKILDMSLARLGDQPRAANVADHIIAADSPTVRVCAAVTLRILRDKAFISELRKALRDPYKRQDGSCVRIGDGNLYPVRIVVADALVELGEDPKEIRTEMGE